MSVGTGKFHYDEMIVEGGIQPPPTP